MWARARSAQADSENPILPQSVAVVKAPPRASHQPEAPADQEGEVLPAVAPLLELDLADAGAVGDVGLPELEPAQHGLELDLLAEGHAVRGQPHAGEPGTAEHPHAGLAVADRLEEQERRGRGQHPVADPVADAHRAPVAEREPAGGEELPAA